MSILKFTRLLVGSVMLLVMLSAHAQQAKKNEDLRKRFDIAVMYQAMRSNSVGGSGFWLQGASGQLHAQLWHGLGGVAELSGMHNGNINSSGVGLDLFTLAFGPRYTWDRPHSRLSLYGQALAGGAFGRSSLFPTSSGSANAGARSLAFSLGGGVNYTLPHHLSLHAVQADWMRTQLPNGITNAQNNLRIGSGILLHFK